MDYLKTDAGFCHLLRPINNKPRKILKYPLYFTYKSEPFNNLVVNGGVWTHKMHELLDLLYNKMEEDVILEKGIIFRAPRLYENLNRIVDFDFIGNRYNKTIKSPLVSLKADKYYTYRTTVHMNFNPEKITLIPITLYFLSCNAQFIYRRFLSNRFVGKSGVYKLQTIIDYLGLSDKRNWVNRSTVIDALFELHRFGFIKLPEVDVVNSVKITKLL